MYSLEVGGVCPSSYADMTQSVAVLDVETVLKIVWKFSNSRWRIMWEWSRDGPSTFAKPCYPEQIIRSTFWGKLNLESRDEMRNSYVLFGPHDVLWDWIPKRHQQQTPNRCTTAHLV